MCAYSLDLRERVVRALNQGRTYSEVAHLFGLSRTTVGRYRRLHREQGHLRAQSPPGRPRQIAPADHPALLEQLTTYPDATLEEHCQRWQQSHGVLITPSTMCRAIQRLGWSYKKESRRQ